LDAEQIKILTDSLRLCDKLLQEHERDRDRIVGCLNGELRKAYLESKEVAEQEIKILRGNLQTMLK